MTDIEHYSFVATQEAITMMPYDTHSAIEAVTIDLDTITVEELITTQKAVLSELEENSGQEEDIETLRKEAYRKLIKKLEAEE